MIGWFIFTMPPPPFDGEAKKLEASRLELIGLSIISWFDWLNTLFLGIGRLNLPSIVTVSTMGSLYVFDMYHC